MSTNYYLAGNHNHVDSDSPEVHIGKCYGAGNGDVAFIWAMHPEFAQMQVSGIGGVTDEYGTSYTPRQFFEEVVRPCIRHEEHSIGVRFC